MGRSRRRRRVWRWQPLWWRLCWWSLRRRRSYRGIWRQSPGRIRWQPLRRLPVGASFSRWRCSGSPTFLRRRHVYGRQILHRTKWHITIPLRSGCQTVCAAGWHDKLGQPLGTDFRGKDRDNRAAAKSRRNIEPAKHPGLGVANVVIIPAVDRQ